MPEHVCDPSGDPCPPWAHPYPSTDEILHRQNRAATERLRTQGPPKAPRVPQRPQGQKDERLVSSMLGRVAGLVVHGYRLTDDQAKTIRNLLGAGSWMGTA